MLSWLFFLFLLNFIHPGQNMSIFNFTNVFEEMSANADSYIHSAEQQFSNTNQRFLSSLSSMNVPMKEQLCKPINCLDCYRFNQYLMCDVCCKEIESYEPVPIDVAVQQETGSSLLFQTNRLFMDSLKYIGLHPVYAGFRSRKKDQTESVRSVINSFNWKYSPKKRLARDVTLEDKEVCGYFIANDEQKVGRVVGGKEVKVAGRYPWQMSLATGFFGFFYQHRCGATLISKRWVLTAAHCMKNLNVANTYVMAGFLAVNNRDTAQIKRIERYISHQRFDANLYEQDIALIKLDSPVVYSSLVLPACLPPPGLPSSSYTSKMATLTGWGRQWNNGPLSDQLHEINLPIISNTECMEWYSKAGSRQYIPENTFLCAGYESGGRDACSGDSGGPLVNFREDQRAEIIGIVSWGLGCGDIGKPGVYTRVSEFLDWIRQTIQSYP